MTTSERPQRDVPPSVRLFLSALHLNRPGFLVTRPLGFARHGGCAQTMVVEVVERSELVRLRGGWRDADVPVTPGPTASTVPAASKPSTVLGGSGMALIKPARRARSVGLMPAALTLILICPLPGSHSGTPVHFSTSGGPYPVITTALGIAVPSW